MVHDIVDPNHRYTAYDWSLHRHHDGDRKQLVSCEISFLYAFATVTISMVPNSILQADRLGLYYLPASSRIGSVGRYFSTDAGCIAFHFHSLSSNFHHPASFPQWAQLKVDTRLKEKYTKENKIQVHVVPHTHDDVGWPKTVDRYESLSEHTHSTYKFVWIRINSYTSPG